MRLWLSHWFGFLFLVPVLVMFAVHEWLGLSDAMLEVRNQKDSDSMVFNFAMVAVFYAGIGAFLLHEMEVILRRGRSRHWVVGKLLFLAAYWGSILIAGSYYRA